MTDQRGGQFILFNANFLFITITVPAKVNESSSQVLKQRKGESTSFYCSAIGTPPLQLVWYKGTRRLSAEGSHKYRAHVTVNKDYTPAILNETFYISNLERSDNDYYSCQTTNSFGGGSKRFQILVQGR